jgi:uncharacterized protein
MADFFFAPTQQRISEATVAKNNFFRTRTLFAASLAIFLAFSFAFSATARRTHAAEISASSPQTDVDAATLTSYQGQYATDADPDRIYSFFYEDGKFFGEAARTSRIYFTAESKTSFTTKGSSTHFNFVVEPGGKVTGVMLVNGNNSRLAKRISDHPVHNHFRPYSRQEAMIPMRDGVKLFAVILRPTDTNVPLPFMMERTPYGVNDNNPDNINPDEPELAASGYIFVFEDIRGRYKSEGKFVMMRPQQPDHKDPKSVDETTDAYDTVAWLLKNIPNNNGRVGVMGTSYPGFLTAEAGIDAHPAVKAISPQAPMTDVWKGDDFFHNGGFRQSYGYDYALGMESGKENEFGALKEDAYDYFLKAGSFAAAAKKSGSPMLPTWQAFLDHASYDKFWSSRAVQPHETKVEVPTLEVGGYWDQEDMWGPQAEYAALKPHDTNHQVFMVLGPWNHGQWGSSTRRLGALDWGVPVSDQFRAQIEAPFFAHYLKDEGPLPMEDTASFQTGSNVWKHYSHWPPNEVTVQNLYMGENGGLSFTAPTGNEQDVFAEYKSDPANPVPYRKRPIEATYAPTGSQWYTWLAQDQSFLADRKDIATFATPVLDHDVTVTGDVYADIFATTTGTDSDWIVKLIDVYPTTPNATDPQAVRMSGYELMIAEEIFRGRYRESFEQPSAIEPNKITEFKYSLHAADHVFLKGHKIMVQVQSTWFPLYDRNPQTFVPNIMTASPNDFQIATQRIFWMPKYPSHLELPVAH